MSKVEHITDWLQHYINGGDLEQSRDRFNWYPLMQEPSVGDDWFYRPVVKDEPLEESQADDNYLPENDDG